jgi:hypothetical protein
MPWDDFARVGSPAELRPMTMGLSLGAGRFPEQLRGALARAGLHTREVADLAVLETLLRDRKPEFVICHAALLGPDPALDAFLEVRATASIPVFLVHEDAFVPERTLRTTRFSEVFGATQSALGCFLMLRAALRRERPHVVSDILEHGNMSLDQEKLVLNLSGTRATLTKLEFCFLGAMLDAPRMIWNRYLMNRIVFGPVDQKPGRQFDTYMSRVRRGVLAKTGFDPIISQRRMGYSLSPWELGAEAFAGMRREDAKPRSA